MHDNRITRAIVAVEQDLTVKHVAGTVTKDSMDKLRDKLDLDVTEWYTFRDTAAWAQAQGIIDLSEAQTVQGMLMHGYSDFNRRPLAEKIVVTKLMQELLAAKILKVRVA